MRRRRSAGLVLGVTALAMTGILAWSWLPAASGGHPVTPAAALPSTSPSAPPSTPPVPVYSGNRIFPNPEHRMLLGAFTDLPGETSMQAAVAQREEAMGRKYNLVLTYYNWKNLFSAKIEEKIIRHKQIPVITWYGPGRTPHSHFDLGKINDGQEDAWILQQAEVIKSFRKTVFLRPMIEMNGNWYEGYSGHPAAFIAAWRRIYDLFARAGVHNVVWVWCPNLGPHDWDLYYPGNSYVDVIGVDGFNGWGSWRSFKQMFQPFLAHFAGRKPLMIGETGTDNFYGLAGSWISGMHAYLKNVAGPRYGVIAVCYFDTKINAPYNWSLDQTPAAWQAWLSLARDPYFGGHGAPAASAQSSPAPSPGS